MRISANKVVTISYELRISDKSIESELVEIVNETEPMYYLHGSSGLPEAFEDQMNGLDIGEFFDFEISVEEGYGPVDKESIVDLPVDLFMIDGKLDEEMVSVGNFLPMTDNEGNQMKGKIVSINLKKNKIVMDFNHPLAGKILHFNGKVLDVREASITEIEHGHVHEDGNEHHH
jgi:FKBP-type peptidyl-prolyl cis-trans isomerase SlyD